jgi:hypothetical protein
MSGGGTQVSTSKQEPWEEQIPFLTAGFEQAKGLYNKGAPAYYGKETLAGFDPTQTAAHKNTLGYAMGPRAAAQQAGAEDRLLKGLSGQIDTATFNPMMDVLGRQMKTQLESNVLPGIRQNLVEYQQGGGSRGDIVQGNAIASANQQMLNKAAEMTYGAQQAAQDRAQNYSQIYPSIMSAPLGMSSAIGDVGDARRAMTQETINRDMARHQYESTAPQQALQNYMGMIQGNYGGQTTQTTPGPSGLETLGQIASIAGPLMMGSDIRIKENIEFDGTWKGHNVYTYNFKGASARSRGVMAQEVEITRPDAVTTIDGIKHVNYGAL